MTQYINLPTFEPKTTAQIKQQAKIQNFKTNNYNNLWFKLQLSTPQARRQKLIQHPQDLLIMLL